MPQHHAHAGPLLNRSLCHSSELSATETRQLAPRPICNSNRCINYLMAGGSRVHVSPILPDWQMPTGSVAGGVGCTVVLVTPVYDAQPWYPILLDLLINYLYYHHTSGFCNRVHLLVVQHQLQLAAWKLSGKTTLQKEFQTGLLSSLKSGWSKGINKAYQSGCARWCSWWLRGKLIPFQALPRVLSQSF